jgi:hypothetical protein
MIITDHSNKAEAAKDDRVEETEAGAPPPYSGPSDYTQPSLAPQSSAAQPQAQQSFSLPQNTPAQAYQDPRNNSLPYAGERHNNGPTFAGYPGQPVPPPHAVPIHNVEGQPLFPNNGDSVRRARWRFLKTFAVALGIYFLGVMLVQSMVDVRDYHDAPRVCPNSSSHATYIPNTIFRPRGMINLLRAIHIYPRHRATGIFQLKRILLHGSARVSQSGLISILPDT